MKDDVQREFIKNYNTILPLIKRVFFYGSLSSYDLDLEGICKSSKYSDNKRTLEYIFGHILEEKKNSSGFQFSVAISLYSSKNLLIAVERQSVLEVVF